MFSIVASLYMAWFLALFAYAVSLDEFILRIIILLCLVAALVKSRLIKLEFHVPELASIVMLVLFVISVIVVFNLQPITKFYFAERWTPVFHWSDAVASWNRWAIQLATGEFHPFHNFYPTGWPGIWSLIYRAQGDAFFWAFSKATLLATHLLLLVSIILFCKYEKTIIAILYGFFATTFFIVYHHWPSASGYMDVPVAMLGFIGLSQLFLWVKLKSEKIAFSDSIMLLIACITIGVASITKQSGILFLLILLLLLVLVLCKGYISSRQFALNSTIACLPILSFGLLYFSSRVETIILEVQKASTKPELFALNETFEAFAKSVGQELGSTIKAIELLNTGFFPGSIYVLFALSILNLFYIRTIQAQFGAILLGAGIIGFLIFSNCCAYDVRNGLWLFSIFGLSALIAISLLLYTLSHSLPNKRRPIRIYVASNLLTVIAVCFSLVVLYVYFGVFSSDTKAWDIAQRSKLTSKGFYNILESKLPAVETVTVDTNGRAIPDKKRNWAIVVSYPSYAYLDPIRGHTFVCRGLDSDCLKAITRCFDTTYFVSTPTDAFYNFNTVAETLPKNKLLGEALRRDRTPYFPHKNQLWGPLPRPQKEPGNCTYFQ